MIPHYLLEKAHAKGSDRDFQAYVQTFPSVLTLRFSEVLHGEGRCEFSHVREVAAGSGTGIKPDYSGVPLTRDEHAMIHQKGESHFNPHDWWIEQRNNMLLNWINGVKPITMEQYDKKRSIFIQLGSPQHIRAFELCSEKHFSNASNPPVEMSLTIREKRKRRTLKQNSAQWGVIYPQMSDYYNSNVISFLWDVARAMWKGWRVNDNLVHDLSKCLFNEGMSTAETPREAHSEYFEKIQRHFIAKHNHEIKSPVKADGFDDFESRFK